MAIAGVGLIGTVALPALRRLPDLIRSS